MGQPPTPAQGRNGRWVRIGGVSVDSAMAAITDPAFAPAKYPGIGSGHNLFSKYGSGVQFSAGFGDGGYDIWAWIVDYGIDESDERIAQIVVTLIDDEDLAHWNSQP
ncbi:hypothetical protein [Mycobacteroides abscessus]|uniref:hypothetical protein n=1 Tax=Mycobacteroides abscessus TaxID=36809 RepID=UPI000941124F|nr:hypothetical protein [Mycobacteroides abscessus]MDB2220676.1 hypothetical protein [Mycobacteroides abscessus subsp. abscessus]